MTLPSVLQRTDGRSQIVTGLIEFFALLSVVAVAIAWAWFGAAAGWW